MFNTYGKAIIAAAYAVAVVVIPFATGDNRIDPSEWVAIAIAVCTAILTYVAPLAPGATWIKTAVGAVLAGLQILTTAIVGGVDGNDVVVIIAAVIGALGIMVAPAYSPPTSTRAGARA
jgi:hypothetical protein